MNKEEQVIIGFRELLNKKIFLNKEKMEKGLKGYKSSEVHCIEYIGRNADSNVTNIADSFYVTRGAASKLTKKLIKKGLIESYQKPGNMKEIYFRLTEQGVEVNKIHDDLHREFQERDKAVIEQITEEEFDIMLHFVEKYNKHLDAEILKKGLRVAKHDDFE